MVWEKNRIMGGKPGSRSGTGLHFEFGWSRQASMSRYLEQRLEVGKEGKHFSNGNIMCRLESECVPGTLAERQVGQVTKELVRR